jgi:hypothetical protein
MNGNMRCECCSAAKGSGLAPLRGFHTHRNRCCSKRADVDKTGSLTVQLFVHVFALFRLIEEATCVLGSLTARIVARVVPFFIPSTAHTFLAPEGKLGDPWHQLKSCIASDQ